MSRKYYEHFIWQIHIEQLRNLIPRQLNADTYEKTKKADEVIIVGQLRPKPDKIIHLSFFFTSNLERIVSQPVVL